MNIIFYNENNNESNNENNNELNLILVNNFAQFNPNEIFNIINAENSNQLHENIETLTTSDILSSDAIPLQTSSESLTNSIITNLDIDTFESVDNDTTNMNLILTNSSFFPSSHLIERIFNDYILNKNKLSEDDYTKYTVTLNHKINECPICFIESDKSVKIINCNHIFCENCIKNWLKNHHNTCPICRTNVKN